MALSPTQKDVQRRYYYSEHGNQKIKQRYRDNKEAHAAAHRLRRYGVTADQWKQLSSNGCSICGIKEKQLVIDHDHANGKTRGVLCKRHNLLVTTLDIPKNELDLLIEYIQRGKQ